VAGFVALKGVELVGRVESWPLTRVSMFSAYRPPTTAPWAVTLEARRGDRWWTLEPGYLGLTPDEMRRRVSGGVESIARGCALLKRTFDASQPPGARLDELRARVRQVPRPGVPRPRRALVEAVVPCS